MNEVKKVTDKEVRAAVEVMKAYCRERLPSCAECIFYLENGDCGAAYEASPDTWTEAEE